MKIFLTGLLVICIFGLFLSILSPSLYQKFYPKNSASGRLKLIVFRPALIMIFLLLTAVSAAGWHNIKYDEALSVNNNETINSPAYTQKQYPVYNSQYDLLKVVDGNHAQIDIRGNKTNVKLIGVKPFSGDDKAQKACYRKHTDAKLRLYLKNKQIELEGDDSLADKNKSDSLLRYVIVNDKNINRQMIAAGYAKAGHQAYKYRPDFLAAEKEARGKNAGFWSAAVCSSYAATPKSNPVVISSALPTPENRSKTSSSKQHKSKNTGHGQGRSSGRQPDKGCSGPTIFDSLLNVFFRRC